MVEEKAGKVKKTQKYEERRREIELHFQAFKIF